MVSSRGAAQRGRPGALANRWKELAGRQRCGSHRAVRRSPGCRPAPISVHLAADAVQLLRKGSEHRVARRVLPTVALARREDRSLSRDHDVADRRRHRPVPQMRAHENPFRISRAQGLAFRGLLSLSEIAARLAGFGYRGAIAGPEGSGKSTLLRELEADLSDGGMCTRL